MYLQIYERKRIIIHCNVIWICITNFNSYISLKVITMIPRYKYVMVYYRRLATAITEYYYCITITITAWSRDYARMNAVHYWCFYITAVQLTCSEMSDQMKPNTIFHNKHFIWSKTTSQWVIHHPKLLHINKSSLH